MALTQESGTVRSSQIPITCQQVLQMTAEEEALCAGSESLAASPV